MNEQDIQFWREDLHFLADQLRTQHANLYHHLSHDQFTEAVARLHNDIPGLSRHAVMVELSRLAASVGDGHTSFWLDFNTSFGFQRYPLRFYEFSDGLIVRQTDRTHQAYLGARLTHIGQFTVEEALARLEAVVSGDNSLMRRQKACAVCNIPEVLHALGLIPELDAGELTLVGLDGKTITLRPPSLMPDAIPEWVNLNQNETPLALWQQHPERFYGFEYLEPHRLVYFNHRVVRHAGDLPFNVFCQQLFDFIDTHPVERLVIDLRSNGGGDNRLNQSPVHSLICCPKVNQQGRLFTIISRHTFSAAMNLAVDLERNTQTLFVGEPTGASPNHYGENANATLPHSGLTLTISKWYWQSSWPDDTRLWIEPQLPVAMHSTDYRNNRDPVLEAVIQYSGK